MIPASRFIHSAELGRAWLDSASQQGRNKPNKLVSIKDTPRRAPQGHGPLGPMSKTLFGIQPVIPIKTTGRTRILANVARVCAKQFCCS